MLTLVIPTRNRSAFLKRALRYYADVACPFPIVIGDSSTGEHMAATLHFLKTFSSKLKIRHIVDPQASSEGLKGWQDDSFLRGLIDEVQTPYVAFYADDDFAVVRHLQKAVDFLEMNKDYSFVCGEAVLFTLEKGEAFGAIACVNNYIQRSFRQEKASERLSVLFSDYTGVEYGVSRTEQKRARWHKVFKARVDNLTGELVNGGLVVLQGKVHKMDQLLLVRQGHALQSSRIKQDIFDWVVYTLCGNYSKMAKVFIEELTDAGTNLDSAQDVVKKAVWDFLRELLMRKWKQKYYLSCLSLSRLKKTVKRIPGMIKFREQIISYFPKGATSLPALLRKSSPHHEDFMPIYRAVENRPSTRAIH